MAGPQRPFRVLFVCLGNICRSPTAEGVMRSLAAHSEAEIDVDSAGTGSWHTGEPPDRRSTEVARRRGIELGGSARTVSRADFEAFDLLVAMDRSNRDELLALAPDAEARERVRLLRDYEPESGSGRDVPDPYYGGPDGFDDVLDIVERCCAELLGEIEAETAGER